MKYFRALTKTVDNFGADLRTKERALSMNSPSPGCCCMGDVWPQGVYGHCPAYELQHFKQDNVIVIHCRLMLDFMQFYVQ